jgi:hypothetical protein
LRGTAEIGLSAAALGVPQTGLRYRSNKAAAASSAT